MTHLKKPISRRAVVLTDSRREARDMDNVIVTLYPNSTIGFRALRCKKEYLLPLSAAYTLAVKADEAAMRKAKKAGKA